MPGLDGTGPQGLGPRTGIGLGLCRSLWEHGPGRGWGPGQRWGGGGWLFAALAFLSILLFSLLEKPFSATKAQSR